MDIRPLGKTGEVRIDIKTWDTTRDGALRQLEDSLTRLQIDHLDERWLHNVLDYARLDAFTSKGSALEAADWNSPTEWVPRGRGLS